MYKYTKKSKTMETKTNKTNPNGNRENASVQLNEDELSYLLGRLPASWSQAADEKTSILRAKLNTLKFEVTH